MARKPRQIQPGQDIHTIFRSVDNSFIFQHSKTVALMKKTLKRMIIKHRSIIYAWVSMSNHQHIFNKSPEPQTKEDPKKNLFSTLQPPKDLVGNMFRDCFSIFAKHFNRESGRVGGVIRDRTKTVKVFDDEQALTLLIYIFLNPVRAGIVRHPRDYPNHNFAMYAYGPSHPKYASQISLFSFHPAYIALGNGWKTRRNKFLWLVEKALKSWGLQRMCGLSASHGTGRNNGQDAYDDFVRFASAWIPKKFGVGQGQGPPN